MLKVNIIDLEKQNQFREENMNIENRNKIKLVLGYFKLFCKRYNIEYQEKKTLWENFISNYQILCKKGYQSDIKLYMKSLGFNNYAFIYEILHDRSFRSLLIKNDNKYLLDIGTKHFEFSMASEYFKDLEVKEILNKKLEGECFDRTLDLVCCMDGVKAIVTYLPNIFAGGYYHAYIECLDGKLVDPASNLVMLNDEAKRLLEGNVILSMNKDEIKLGLEQLKEVDGIEEYDRPKLLKLALLCECKRVEENLSLNNAVKRR